MKLIKISLLFFLISFSGLSLADTYPAVSATSYHSPAGYHTSLDDAKAAVLSSYGWVTDDSTYYISYVDCVPYTCVDVKKRQTSNNALLNGYSIAISTVLSCPFGGTLSGSSCINALACLVGETRDSTGECKPIPLNCGANEYDNAGVCAPIPDCNADAPLGLNFFDVETKSCKTIEGVGTICISEESPKYCPPIDDCKPAGYICSNEPNQKAIEDAARASAIASAAASAAEKKAQADEIAAAAAAAASSKTADTQAVKDALAAAKDALSAAKASGDQDAIAAAIKEYSKALNGVQDASAREANSKSASDAVQTTNVQVGIEVSQIPSSNPGNASAHDRNIGDLIPGMVTGLDDAISGDGAGTGRGSGVPTSTSSTSIDTSGLATDSTAKAIEANTKGILDGLKDGGNKGSFGAAPDSFYESEYPNGISGVWDSHKAALNQTSFVSAVSGLTPSVGGDSGSCPSWTLPPVPYLSSSSYDFQPPCEIWPLLRVIFIITALFTARSLIFGG